MTKTWLVDEEDAKSRLDAFLAQHVENTSRAFLAKAIAEGFVSINGTTATQKSEKLKLGDSVSYQPPAPVAPLVSPEALQLDIRYEDEYLGVISKPDHLICHPSSKHKQNTLSQILEATYGPEHLGKLQGQERLGLVHRLDGDTSGLMLFAKDDETQEALQDQIRLRTLDRRYIVLVHGNIGQNSGLIDVSLGRSKKQEQYIAATTRPGAREALTAFRVLERFSHPYINRDYTLVECHLYTGRTHQIRVHMAYIGHHVVGDVMYGAHALEDNLGLTRQFLHSRSVQFVHPKNKKSIKVTDDLPYDLANVYNVISGFSLEKTEAGREVFSELTQVVSVDGKDMK